MATMRLLLVSLFHGVRAGLIVAGLFCCSASGQSSNAPAGPDPREIPVPPITTKLKALPGVSELPARSELPDIMTMNDGKPVTTARQWKKRREEIRTILEYYATGRMPPPPGNVRAEEVSSQRVLNGQVKYRLVRLTFGPNRVLALNIGIFAPVDGGPFPAIISPSGTPPGAAPLPRLPNGPTQGRGVDVLLVVGSNGTNDSSANPSGAVSAREPASAEIIATRNAELFHRGYALVVFNNNDCAEDTTLRNPDGSWAFRNTRFYPLYPEYDWGILAGWAWGASRIAD